MAGCKSCKHCLCSFELTRRRATALLCVALLGAGAGRAESLRYCDTPAALSATQQDHLLRFAEVIKRELEDSGAGVALISRTGLDLSRFGQRYSHAGVAVKDGLATPWAVRQLYFACDERKPKLFDQGMAGFIFSTHNPALGHVSIVTLPNAAAAPLQAAALNKPLALGLLGAGYSANAHAFGLQYQNCNQWVAELLAAAWGQAVSTREAAQRWLKAMDYVPSRFELGSPLWLWLAQLLPWFHTDDQPDENLQALTFQVSMPQSIEAFVRAHVPGAQRIEICHNAKQIVVRRGWLPVLEGCVAEAQDTVLPFNPTAP